MCGIAGIISLNKSLVNTQSLKKMADTLVHRGPDDEGFFINQKATVGLAHRRLSIIDLSDKAAQPMHYMQRYTIVYNGEIYNYKELKNTLQQKGYTFQNEGDTEVILAAFDFYKDECVIYFDGMFAFAIWDEETQILFCARDNFGEKPFYFYQQKDAIYFASEMKALWATGISKNIDEGMVAAYLGVGQVQNPRNKSQTFFKNIFALPAAHTISFSPHNNEYELKRYFDIDKKTQISNSESNAVEKISELLQTSISRRLRSDVPIGTSLSGGIDSSTIAYFISQQNGNKNFKTFSAVFPGFEKDESILIDELSAQLNFENYKITPNAKEFVKDFGKIAYHQEEPFSSASIFAQYKVYELAAANNIKVLLDGQGADEVFAGYTKYIHWYLQEVLKNKPFDIFDKEKQFLKSNNVAFNWSVKNYFATYLPSFAANTLERKTAEKINKNTFLHKDLLQDLNAKNLIYKPTVTKLNDILYHNTMELGLEELLRFADRNSMANGVEVRLPFLNKDLVQFVFSLPTNMKIAEGFTKNILRKTMNNKVPNNILWNPIKTGFEPPQKSWMEDKMVQEMIQESKQKLVQEKIVSASILEKQISPSNAHDESNFDWRMLSLAQVIK